MTRVKLLCFIFAVITTKITHAISKDTVIIRGTVYDLYLNRPLAGVSVIHSAWGQTTVTDISGKFTIRALRTDTLFLFYPAYRTLRFSVADSAPQQTYNLVLGIEPLQTGIGQAVIIKAPKTLEQIERERRELGKTPEELERPVIEPFTSPISALYDMFSRRAREREKLKQQIVEDDRRKIMRELLDYFNENQLIDLPESYYEDFIRFSEISIEFLKYSTDYEITRRVVEEYNRYGRLNGIIK
ncbi:MAG: carboxypeptidase-like regulatory domain-containing protein [Chitinophagales bacterium]|nr:carboxypeptidase-like regulatory domain-containing protein [Chitinophagales bacterium]MDW8418762.1 hypothetical protein [Chitinophagales bacterium]